MIEPMLIRVKAALPLEIGAILLDGGALCIHGND
jgi:hypothetical protein